MSDDLLNSLSADNSREEMVWEATRDYLASLPPEVEDAAYRCIIVRWFNQGVLEALLGDFRLAHIGREFEQAETGDAESLYARLRDLPFVEEYPGRGHNFHDLTRKSVLEHLWQLEPEFYRNVSARAAEFFGKVIDSEEPDWGYIIEWIYHMLVADEATGIWLIENALAQLGTPDQVGRYHALVQVAEEQAQAGRLSPGNLPLVRLWRVRAVALAESYSHVENLTKELLALPDEAVAPWIKAEANWYLANAFYQVERYDEAFDSYMDTLRRAEQIESIAGAASALKELGKTCYTRGQLPEAEGFYTQALELLVRLSIITISQDGKIVATPTEDITLPENLELLNPQKWFAWPDFYDSYPKPESDAEGESTDEASLADSLVYGIEMGQKENSDPSIALPLKVDQMVAGLWAAFGSLYQELDDYDLAADCVRLAGQMYLDLGDDYNLLAILQILYSIGGAVGDLNLKASDVAFQNNMLEVARQRSDRHSELQALLGLAASYLDKEEYDKARETYSAARDLAHLLKVPVSEAASIENLARLDQIAGENDKAETGLLEALEIYRRTGYREGQALTLLRLGDFERDHFRSEQAAEHYYGSLELLKTIGISSSQFNALRGLGLAAEDRLRYEEAIEHFQLAVELARKLKSPAREALGLSDLGRVHNLLGNYTAARQLYQQALEISRKIRQRADEAYIHQLLGDLAADMEAFDEATEFYSEARAIYASLNQPSQELNSMVGLLTIQRKKGNTEAYVKAAQEALDFARQVKNRIYVNRMLMELGLAYSEGGRHGEAIELIRNVINLEPANPLAVGNLGWVLYQAGEYEQSIQHSRRALEMDATQTWVLRNIGHAQLATGKPDEAEKSYQEAIAARRGNENFKEAIKEVKQLLKLKPDIQGGEKMLALFENAQAELDAITEPVTASPAQITEPS